MRVNRLSLSLLQLFREPLADVLRGAVMDPIGASPTGAWQPYRNSWVEIDGVPHAVGARRLALGRRALDRQPRPRALRPPGLRRGGVLGQRRSSRESWIDEMRRPCPINPAYGLLWWLNTGRTRYAVARRRRATPRAAPAAT